MERNHTLRTIANELGRDKRTVQNWYAQAKDQYEELGEIVDGTRYFSNEERSILISHAGAERSPSKVSAKVRVESGNHQMVLNQPELPQSYTLEGLRKTESVTFDDPIMIATQFLRVADQLIGGMQTDIEKRETKLNQTRQARETIANKASELRLEARLYTERTRGLDTSLSQETQSLQDALATIQQLGKPLDGATGG